MTGASPPGRGRHGPQGPRLHAVDEPLRTASRTKPGKMAAAILADRAALPAPVSVPADAGRPRGPALVPTTVVPQHGIAAGYDPRYQCAPGERPHGAGFAAAGIGRDVATGLPWTA